MKPRKVCETCKLPLIAQNGHYLHPDTVCNGIKDMIFIEATIEDDFLHDKFIELYGKPEMDDYDKLAVYETHTKAQEELVELLRSEIENAQEKLSIPVVKWVLWICSKFKRK